MQTHVLYHGDNLHILRQYIRDESVDLLYADPPFNSHIDYKGAFRDIWHWNSETEAAYTELQKLHKPVATLLTAFRQTFEDSRKTAYLTMMAIRLLELHRILKPAGCFYLHCDPTASHYLKVLLDAIFDEKNYQNEIVWGYKTGGTPQRNSGFARKHDILHLYTKSSKTAADTHTNPQRQKSYVPTLPEPHTSSGKRLGVKRDELQKYRYVQMRDWWVDTGLIPDEDIRPLFRNNTERLGYPTQKPLKLLERIITASSREGDIVLDAFCGSGTTLHAAQQLNRRWIGIDSAAAAIEIAKTRLEETFGKPVKVVVEKP